MKIIQRAMRAAKSLFAGNKRPPGGHERRPFPVAIERPEEQAKYTPKRDTAWRKNVAKKYAAKAARKVRHAKRRAGRPA